MSLLFYHEGGRETLGFQAYLSGDATGNVAEVCL